MLHGQPIVCFNKVWFYEQNSREVPHNNWWREKGANDRPPESIIFRQKVYFEKQEIKYLPLHRNWIFTDGRGPLNEESFEGERRQKGFEEIEQAAEEHIPDELIDEFIRETKQQVKRNLQKPRGGNKSL